MTTPLLVQTDTAPLVTATITNDATSQPLDLTDCQVFIEVRKQTDRRFVINGTCVIVDAQAGQVSYQLTGDDLDFAAACLVRFLVVYSDSRRQHTVPALPLTVEQQ